MSGLDSLEGLFDDPCFEPPPGPPPFGAGDHVQKGSISGPFAGKMAFELVMALANADKDLAIELVEFGSLWLDNRVMEDPSRILSPGFFRLNMPPHRPRVFYEIDPARIVHSDSDVIVYDKEAGRPSQGVPHDARNNVLAAMERRTGLALRLIHRLDAPTSGLLMIAATKLAASRVGDDLRRRKVRKRYLAMSQGEPPAWRETEVDAPIGKEGSRYLVTEEGKGLSAKTKLTLLARSGEKLLFMAEPLTGRTHQIRLHMAFLGYPVSGDKFYGGAPDLRLMLRASGLAFRHPGDARELVFGGPWDAGDLASGK